MKSDVFFSYTHTHSGLDKIRFTVSTMENIYSARIKSPGWCGSVDSVLACEPKSHQFDSQSGQMPGL